MEKIIPNKANRNSVKGNNENNKKEGQEEKYEKEKIKLFGLINPKFNCYLNSSLQAFLHLKYFNEKIKEYKSNIYKNNILTYKYLNLLNQIDEGKKQLDPKEIKEYLSKIENKYKYDYQEDANEFITLFLNQMMKELKNLGSNSNEQLFYINDEREKKAFKRINKIYDENNSFFLNLFYGILKKELICSKCQNKMPSFQIYNMLELPNSNKNCIEDLFQEYQEQKIIKNKIQCGNCNKENNFYSKTTIFSLPYYIILFFDQPIKNINNISTFETKNFFSNNKGKNEIYELVCSIGYSGNFKSGHYIAKCKELNNNWYYFSDIVFYELNKENPIDKNDVILFYSKT